MRFMEMRLKDLKPYENNPRKNDAGVAAVRESIKQCGYIAPIVVDENMEILAGHTRYKALKKLGIEVVPVAVVKGLTDDQKRKYRILDNRTGEMSYWDYEKLYIELEGLDFEGFQFGFEKLTDAMDQDFDNGIELDMEDFNDDAFKHECPECGFRFD